MKFYSEEQVKKLLAEQRHNCQIERNKRSYHDERGWFVHCEDVMNAEEPELPNEDDTPNRFIAHCCPVCNGNGVVRFGFYLQTTSTVTPEPCRSCNGTGIVWHNGN